MKNKKPCSPSHSLLILNENMRTDILREIHIHCRKLIDENIGKHPLEKLILSIEHTLKIYKSEVLIYTLERNPFNKEEDIRTLFPFKPEEFYKNDIKLLKFQLSALRKTMKEIESMR